MRLTTGKPKPCPLDLVVKRGVKSLGRIFSGIPVPVSWTLMARLLFVWVAVRVSSPYLGMAWTALLTRLVRMRLRKALSV